MAADGSPLAFRAALHVGQVVYGSIGSSDRLDFTVLAATVNLIGRLEGLAKQLDRATICSAGVARDLAAPLAFARLLAPEGGSRSAGTVRAG